MEWIPPSKGCPLIWPGFMHLVRRGPNARAAMSKHELAVEARNVSPADGPIGTVVGATPIISDEFLAHIDMLVDAGLVTLAADDNKRGPDSPVQVAADLIAGNPDVVVEGLTKDSGSVIKISDAEATALHEQHFGPFHEGKLLYPNFLFEYYAVLLGDLLDAMGSGRSTVSSSSVLSDYLRYAYAKSQVPRDSQVLQHESASSILDILKLNVPDVSSLSFEEVLDIRSATRDELLGFQYEMDKLSQELTGNLAATDLVRFGDELTGRTRWALNQLESKIRSSNLGVLRRLFERILSPKSYVPLLATITADLPKHLALLASLGLISVATSLDLAAERAKVSENGFFYLFQLRRLSGS